MSCPPAALLLLLTCVAFITPEAGGSPCDGRYDPWLTRLEEFVRKDEPRHLAGLHVACVWMEDGVKLEAHLNGVLQAKPLHAGLPAEVEKQDWATFRKALQDALKFTKKSNEWGYLHLKQPFGIFDVSGHRLGSAGEVLDAGLVLIFEGGQWFWPPVHLGYVRQLPGTPFELETMSVQPVVFRVRGFLREEECSTIIDLGKDEMIESPVSPMDTAHKDSNTKEFRTSTQARINSARSPVLGAIDYRISNLTRVPVSHNEEVQVLRYEKGQFYSAHNDNFDPQYYINSAEGIDKGHRNRILTVFWYLTNVSAGGETLFPRADGLPQPRDMHSCEKGLKVKPEVGTVILWYSLRPNGNSDPNGLHAACPVEEGQKWSANYWVWNKPRIKEAMPDWGLDGESEESDAPGSSQVYQAVTAIFENVNPSKSVYLFWKRPENSEEVPMGEIPAKRSSSMNTYVRHVWHIRDVPAASSGRLLSVKEVTSDPKQVFQVGATDPELDEL